MNVNFSYYKGINYSIGILHDTEEFVPMPTDTADVNMQNREGHASLICQINEVVEAFTIMKDVVHYGGLV